MIKCLIFDLSEVLIRGIVGVEKQLTERLNIPPKNILRAFGGDNLVQLCLGKISEESYLTNIINLEKWLISADELKKQLRNNFLITIKGMPSLIAQLSEKYQLILLSDHAREWIEFIEAHHDFLKYFDRCYYSFIEGRLKSEKGTFENILKVHKLNKQEVVFIDDNPENAEAAKNNGIRSIVFINKNQLWQLLNTEK